MLERLQGTLILEWVSCIQESVVTIVVSAVWYEELVSFGRFFLRRLCSRFRRHELHPLTAHKPSACCQESWVLMRRQASLTTPKQFAAATLWRWVWNQEMAYSHQKQGATVQLFPSFHFLFHYPYITLI